MADQPQKVKHDLLDALSILDLKKVATTTWAFIKDPKRVVESIQSGDDEFMKAIKYLLTIGAPIIIALNIIGHDLGAWEAAYTLEKVHSNPDPAIREKAEIIAQFAVAISSKMTELSPFIYLIIMPVLALITKVFYKPLKEPSYYFISLAYFIGGVLCLWDLASELFLSFFKYQPFFSEINRYVGYAIVAYFNFRMLVGSTTIRLIKSAAISFIFGGLVWLLTMLALTITLYFSKFSSKFDFKTFNYKYLSHYVMGESSVPLNAETDSLVNKYNLKIKRGYFVIGTYPNSPAEMAGLKEGDVIISVKGVLTQEFRDMRIALDSVKSEDTLNVLVNRNGNEVQLQIPVIPADSLVKKPKVLMGLLRKFQPNSVNKYGFKNGSIITEVVKNSPAEEAGLHVNDIIVIIDKDTVQSWRIDEVARIRDSQKNPGDTTWVGIIRDQKYLEIYVIMKRAGELQK